MLTSAQAVRLRIRDLPVIADDTYIGDGSGRLFNLPHENISSGSAFVPGANGQWSATAAAFNASGFVEFDGTISANSAWRARYVHSVFSDEDIEHRLTTESGLTRVSLAFVKDLMFDGLKRAKWAAPDGSEYDDTKAIDLLDKLYRALAGEIAEVDSEAAIAGGAIAGWAVTQGE